jgi:hypothetical protein
MAALVSDTEVDCSFITKANPSNLLATVDRQENRSLARKEVPVRTFQQQGLVDLRLSVLCDED